MTLTCILSAMPVSAQVQEGDTLNFWSVSYVDWPPLWGSPQRQFDAVCKKVGSHCYVFVETGATIPSQSIMDDLVTSFDTHFYPALTPKYGPVPDQFDHDSNVYIVALNENYWAGYFDPGQQMPDSLMQAYWNMRSNQREIIYIAANAFNSSAEEIVAHEFGHLLHWGKDHSVEPANPGIFWEEAFVDEGFSTFAAEYLTRNLFQHNVYDNSAFFRSNPDIPLIYFSDYNQAKLFMTFMFEHFGQWNYISALIGNQLNGWQGVDSTLRQLGYNTTFKEAFEQFCVANYADDSVYLNGKYSYDHFSFPDCYAVNNHSSFPTANVNGTLVPFGSDYITFNASTPKPVEVIFQGDSLSEFRLAFIMMNPSGSGIHKVVSVTPDASGHAVFVADSLGTAYTKLVMVAMCTDTGLDTIENIGYSYTATQYAATPEVPANSGFRVYPNPAKDKLFVELPSGMEERSTLEIFDTSGNQKSSYPVNKKTKSIDISMLSPGIYILRVKLGNTILSARFVCIK